MARFSRLAARHKPLDTLHFVGTSRVAQGSERPAASLNPHSAFFFVTANLRTGLRPFNKESEFVVRRARVAPCADPRLLVAAIPSTPPSQPAQKPQPTEPTLLPYNPPRKPKGPRYRGSSRQNIPANSTSLKHRPNEGGEEPWPLPTNPSQSRQRPPQQRNPHRRGKAATVLNALKHGLRTQRTVLPDENIEDFHALVTELKIQFQPVTALEYTLLRQLADAEWCVRRIPRIEAGFADIGPHHHI